MAIRQTREGAPGSEQHMGVDVGAQAGTGSLFGRDAGEMMQTATEVVQSVGESIQQAAAGLDDLPTLKVIKPLPHAVMDYAMAGTLMAAPWLFGFSRNRAATTNAVASGAAILGLSLLTRYPLGAARVIPFPVHGVIEAAAGLMTAAAPWLMGFARDRSATATHLASGLGTLAVFALTDYGAANGGDGRAGGDASGGGA